jgi:two-component system, NarL family, response regulator DevR
MNNTKRPRQTWRAFGKNEPKYKLQPPKTVRPSRRPGQPSHAVARAERPPPGGRAGVEEGTERAYKRGVTTHDSVSVFLLDDHEVVRRGIRDLLQAEPGFAVVGETGSAQEAVRRIPALRPDVAVLDARLPDGSGIDVCREIRSVDPSIQALILTSYDDDEALFTAIMAGAAGYILKEVSGGDLIDSIRRVSAGQSLLDPAVTQRVLDRLRRGDDEPSELRNLTEQERRVLALIAEGMTNKQIGERLFLAEKTVKNYVSSLLSKLGLERRTQAAVLASKLLGRST